MHNIVLLLIALVSIIFLWLIWARVHILHEYQKIEKQKDLILCDCDKRRDFVPLLLEGFKFAQQANQGWHELVQARAEFRSSDNFEKEKEFASILLNFNKNNDTKEIHFLEAKKEITHITKIIDKEFAILQDMQNNYMDLISKLPYSFVAKLFKL